LYVIVARYMKTTNPVVETEYAQKTVPWESRSHTDRIRSIDEKVSVATSVS